ncbi:unnamed protein product [Mortierella alpina]
MLSNYSIQIPAVNHWPTLLTQYARKGVRAIHENRRSSNPKTATYGCDCFDHEEPVKVVLRQDRKMHVYDVKKHATREMDYRHASYSPETVRLLAAHLPGLLKPDDVWNNNRHFNSAHYPVIAIQTGYELIGLLNRTLACFSTFSALVSDRFKTRSQQKFEDYQQLYNILQTQLANPTSSSSLQ